MSGRVKPLAGESGADPLLDNLLAEFAHKLEAGEPVDPEVYAREHPERAAQLRHLLPAIQALAGLDASSKAANGAVPVPTADGAALAQVGDFRLVRELGRGGMGIVYEAEQLSLHRRVALKMLPLSAALDPRQRQRFLNESQAAAHLHHTNIVPVFGVGCERGVHYYVMQLIEGQTMAALIADLRRQAGLHGEAVPDESGDARSSPATMPQAALTTEPPTQLSERIRTVASWGMQVAEALAHAHDQGIVHRDIKPANLLLDERGKVWITDFGLARFHDQTGITLTGDLVGTLRYMSPEQALGRRLLIDAHTDTYSLGATLYELLTLEPVFTADDRQALLHQIAFEEPRPLRRLNRTLPTELETILRKAMEKHPAERYATAQDLADDLRRFLEDKPIQARRPTALQHVRKWTRRHRSLVITLSTALVALLLAVSVVSTMAAVRIAAASERAKASAADAAEKAENLERENYRHSVALAYREYLGNNVGQTDKLLDQCPAPLRGWEWYFCKRLGHLELQTFQGARGRLVGLAFNGKSVALADENGVVKLWDAATREAIFTAHPGMATSSNLPNHGNCLALSPDGKWLALCTQLGVVQLLDAQTGRSLLTLPGSPGLTGVAFSSAGDRLATVSLNGIGQIWDLANGGRATATLRGHSDWVFGVAFSPDGTQLATASFDRTLRLWNAKTGRLIRICHGHERGLYSVAFSPDGKRVASTSFDCTAKVWDTATGKELLTLRGHTSFVRGVAFSPDGTRLATCAEDNAIKLWDARDGRELFTLRGHTNFVVFVAFSPSGDQLASASHDGTVRVWDVTQERQPLRLGQHQEWIRRVAFSPDGKWIATATGHVTLWDAATGRAITRFPGSTGSAKSLAVSPDGQRLAWGNTSGNIYLGNTATGELLRTFRRSYTEILSLAFSPDGQRLASAGADGVISIWDMRPGQPIRHFRADPSYVYEVQFSPDGRWIASAGGDGTVKLWGAATLGEKEVGAWQVWQNEVEGGKSYTLSNALAFSPDSQRLAAAGGSWDRGRVFLWDVPTGREVRVLEGHTLMVNSVTFSPDGKRLASASNDGTIRLWDVTTSGEETFILRGHHSGVLSLAFSPDGHRLASGSIDFTLRLWDATPLEETAAPLETRERTGTNRLRIAREPSSW
jgi:WD40 repeat protein/serine/threonine protein kinase